MTRILPSGRDAVVVEFDSHEEVARAFAALRARQLPGIDEMVPAARTILLSGSAARDVATSLATQEWPAPPCSADSLVEIAVTYDGPDLDEIATRTGLPREEVVRLHATSDHRVAFCGFAPGFAYLTGLPPALHVPRRGSPRTSIPAGSVAIAGEFTGIYPRASPGGWQWIGRAQVDLWNPERDPPTLLVPGTRVRFTVA